MPPTQAPLEITLEITSTRKREESYPFPWKEEPYFVHHSLGRGAAVDFRWPTVRLALEALTSEEPESRNLKHLSEAMRDFLQPAEWVRAENDIRYALSIGQPVHITVRSNNADDLYYLPWELLPVGQGGPALAGMENCLVRYECKSSPTRELVAPPMGRILFAWSKAGGWVPSDAHLDAIRAACDAAGFPFLPEQDLLPNVSSQRLVEKLSETERPVTALHLLCHGAEIDKGAYGLVFDAAESEGEPEHLDSWKLTHLLFSSARPSPLRLVTLCACQGGDSGTPAHPLGSIARMFHVQGVPAVIASRLPLTCLGSVKLAETIYPGLLVRRENLRTALSSVRKKLRETGLFSDGLSLQLYARAGDDPALSPFTPPPSRPRPAASRPDLVLLCHEAYGRVLVPPTEEDVPELFARRHIRPELVIDQHSAIGERRWENLESEVARLAARNGLFRNAFSERGTEILYYGFPYVPLALLAGYLANTRPVHVLEHDRTRQRFTWQTDSEVPHPPLEIVPHTREAGSAARVRVSVSSEVKPEDCSEVLADPDILLDLHFKLSSPERGIVRREAQVLEYARDIRQAIDQHIGGKREFTSVHVFAAVPVSIAFHLGRALASTGLPECFVYNYDARDEPRYKWRLSLKAAAEEQPSVKVFTSPPQGANANHG